MLFLTRFNLVVLDSAVLDWLIDLSLNFFSMQMESPKQSVLNQLGFSNCASFQLNLA